MKGISGRRIIGELHSIMISSPLAKKQKLLSAACAQISTKMSSFLLNSSHNTNIISNLAGIPSDAVLIGTHDGSFHCDEVLAISMLSTLPAYKPSANTYIVRSRNPEILEVSLPPFTCANVSPSDIHSITYLSHRRNAILLWMLELCTTLLRTDTTTTSAPSLTPSKASTPSSPLRAWFTSTLVVPSLSTSRRTETRRTVPGTLRSWWTLATRSCTRASWNTLTPSTTVSLSPSLVSPSTTFLLLFQPVSASSTPAGTSLKATTSRTSSLPRRCCCVVASS